MRILVLGGTGAMGVPLVEILSGKNEVYVTSRSPRISHKESIRYIQGDAHEETFFKELLQKNAPFDVIIDFMIYKTPDFEKRMPLLLSSAKHYLYFSSSRVYADSKEPIVETSPRLLDVSTDREYLETDEYALAKARQEDLIAQSGSENWTIVRPYITYNMERLQLGVFEKEYWLYRALHKRTIVFPRDIAETHTTLTYGGDVARAIAQLAGNKNAFGQKVHVATANPIKWDDVLGAYLDVLEAYMGQRPHVEYTDSSEWLRDVKRDYYAVTYDRLFDRCFDNTKIQSLCEQPVSFIPAEEGLKKCLTEFLQNGINFKQLHWKYEAYVDRMTGEYTPLDEIRGIKKKWRYIRNRYI